MLNFYLPISPLSPYLSLSPYLYHPSTSQSLSLSLWISHSLSISLFLLSISSISPCLSSLSTYLSLYITLSLASLSLIIPLSPYLSPLSLPLPSWRRKWKHLKTRTLSLPISLSLSPLSPLHLPPFSLFLPFHLPYRQRKWKQEN